MSLVIRAVAFILLSLAAVAAEIEPSRHVPLFSASPSMHEVAAVKKFAKPQVAQAMAAKRPFELSVARAGGTTLISLESVALCNRDDGCPLLVFRNIDKAPVLTTMSFHNLVLEYRGKATYLIPRRSGPRMECLISTESRAVCRPPKPAKGGA
ncbi:MAG: hypothetical protein HYU60_06535 [Magnetospirillum sp.]|nr:hypothetical protein [Magnetospirillum sp.]